MKRQVCEDVAMYYEALPGAGEAGLDHYEVRSWVGWHHHMTLSANCHMIPISFVPHDPDHLAVFWSGKPHLSPEVDMSYKMIGRPSVVGRSSPPSVGGARSTRSPRSST